VTAVRVYVPESALMEKSNNVAEVWVLDQSNERVERRRVSLDLDERDGYIRAREGLRPGDRVVANPPADLRAGERVIAANTNL
jgi:multidrug efflux pump subunit AcrA (membrane-fusion protein)